MTQDESRTRDGHGKDNHQSIAGPWWNHCLLRHHQQQLAPDFAAWALTFETFNDAVSVVKGLPQQKQLAGKKV